MGFSNVVANEILTNYYRTDPVYLALYLTDPTDNDTGTEVAGGDYARIEIPFGAIFDDAGKRAIANAVELQSNVATADWGTVTFIALRTAATGGGMISKAQLQTPKTILAGERFAVLLGDGKVRLR